MTAADRSQLVVDHLAVAQIAARTVIRRLPPWVDVEDVTSAGTLGLLSAARRFDASRGTTFRTFAVPRVRGAVLDYLRTGAPMSRNHVRETEARVIFTPFSPARHADVRTETPAYADVFAARRLRKAVRALPTREARLIVWRFWHGLTQAECAPRLGVKESRVSQLERRALEQLRAHLQAAT